MNPQYLETVWFLVCYLLVLLLHFIFCFCLRWYHVTNSKNNNRRLLDTKTFTGHFAASSQRLQTLLVLSCGLSVFLRYLRSLYKIKIIYLSIFDGYAYFRLEKRKVTTADLSFLKIISYRMLRSSDLSFETYKFDSSWFIRTVA